MRSISRNAADLGDARLRHIERAQLECAAKLDQSRGVLAGRDDGARRAHFREPGMILRRPDRLFEPMHVEGP